MALKRSWNTADFYLTHLDSILASDQLLNPCLHSRRTVDLVLHHFHCKYIMKGSSNGQYEQEESLQRDKQHTVFILAPDCCFKTVLKNSEPFKLGVMDYITSSGVELIKYLNPPLYCSILISLCEQQHLCLSALPYTKIHIKLLCNWQKWHSLWWSFQLNADSLW